MEFNSKFSDISNTVILPKVENLDIAQELQVFYNRNFLPKQFFMSVEEEKAEKRKKKIKNFLNDNNNSNLLPTILTAPEFCLILSDDFDLSIYKGKYFSIKVLLKPMKSFSLPCNENVELGVLVYDKDGVLITKNTKGGEIIRGKSVQNLSYFSAEGVHSAYFKLQITEVSSHYLGKTISIKIQARKSHFLKAKGWKIKSILIPNITVRAKEVKSKLNT